MKLSLAERWILYSQYRILEALYPEEAKDFELAREAIACGYELDYLSHCEQIDISTLPEEDCHEVLDILSMFEALPRAYGALADKSGIDSTRLRFKGFDGNKETKLIGYVRHLQRSGHFLDLVGMDGLNSHMPILDIYREMLAEWKRSASIPALTREDLIRIASVWDPR